MQYYEKNFFIVLNLAFYKVIVNLHNGYNGINVKVAHEIKFRNKVL